MYQDTTVTGCCGSARSACQRCGGPRFGPGGAVLTPPWGSRDSRHNVTICGSCENELIDMIDRWLDVGLPIPHDRPRPPLPAGWKLPARLGMPYSERVKP